MNVHKTIKAEIGGKKFLHVPPGALQGLESFPLLKLTMEVGGPLLSIQNSIKNQLSAGHDFLSAMDFFELEI